MADRGEQLRLLSTQPGQESKVQAMRRRARDMVEGDMDTWFEYSVLIVIFVNVLALVVSSVRAPEAREHHWCATEVRNALSCTQLSL